jgi:hypothetical protein
MNHLTGVSNLTSNHRAILILMGPTTRSRSSPRSPSKTQPFCSTSTSPVFLISAIILRVSGISSLQVNKLAAFLSSSELRAGVTSDGQHVLGGSRDASRRSRWGFRASSKFGIPRAISTHRRRCFEIPMISQS